LDFGCHGPKYFSYAITNQLCLCRYIPYARPLFGGASWEGHSRVPLLTFLSTALSNLPTLEAPPFSKATAPSRHIFCLSLAWPHLSPPWRRCSPHAATGPPLRETAPLPLRGAGDFMVTAWNIPAWYTKALRFDAGVTACLPYARLPAGGLPALKRLTSGVPGYHKQPLMARRAVRYYAARCLPAAERAPRLHCQPLLRLAMPVHR